MDDPSSRSDRPPRHAPVLRLRKVVSVRAGAELSAADLFSSLWLGLAEILGTAAAATLLRRATQRAALGWPELTELGITRENLEYRYVVPAAWNDPTARPPHALCELTRELWTFLVDLTGSVVVNRLAQIPELRDHGIVPRQEAQR